MVRIWVVPLQQRRPMGFTFRQTDTYEHIIRALSSCPRFNSVEVWDPWNGDYLVHIGLPIVSGSPLMDCFTFKAMNGPYEPEAERAALISTADQGVGTHEPVLYYYDALTYGHDPIIYMYDDLVFNGNTIYNIYNDTPEPEAEHDFTSAELVPGLQLHNLFGNLLVSFQHWHATVIQRAYRRHISRRPPAYTEDFFAGGSTASSENVMV